MLEKRLKTLFDKSNPRLRREQLISQMSELNDQGKDCFQCEGAFCCTSQFNSMRISPIELIDLYFYLKAENRLNEELEQLLQKTREQYRLDKEIFLGRGKELRRTYTCPFLKLGELGCTISRGNKPYGCLAFNPEKRGVNQPGFCSSDQKILQVQADLNQADENLNQEIRELLKLDWNSKDIPSALLSLIQTLKKL